MVNQQMISIIIPAHNEARRLPLSLGAIQTYIADYPGDYEVIVVANGCIDDTVRVTRRCMPGARVIELKEAGKGLAVRTGMLEAQGDLLYMCDADLSTPIRWLYALANVPAVDIVIGSREGPGARRYNESTRRHISGRIFNLLIRCMTGLPYQDTQCGFKLFHRVAARDLFSECIIDGFAFDVEVLWLARCMGYRVREVGVHWYNDPRTTVHLWRDSARMIRDIIRMRTYHDHCQFQAETIPD